MEQTEIGGRHSDASSPPVGKEGKGSTDGRVHSPRRRGRFYERVGDALRRRWRRIDERLIKLVSRSGRASSWYYALFNRTFDREHRAVLRGRIEWEQSKRSGATTTSLLRRNIHRLEKGLIMRPRRPHFALDYIRETIEFYEEVCTTSGSAVEDAEHRWAHDVLTEYFAATAPHPLLDALRVRFNGLTRRPDAEAMATPYVPYKRALGTAPSVDYEALVGLAWRRRSVRWFDSRPVPRALIEKAAVVASLSPSACNRQPFYFHIFDDPALLPEVAALPGGTLGFSDQFPAVVAVIGELRNYYGERDRHLIYIDASLAVMSFILAAETLGLSTCCINWPDLEEDERRAAEVLHLSSDQRPVMFIAIGYPDPEGLVPYSQKKPPSQFCRYNFE